MKSDENRIYHLEVYLADKEVSEEINDDIPASGVRREFLEDIASELEEDVEISGITSEQLAAGTGTATAIALGSLAISSANLLFQIYKFLQERDDVDSGGIYTEGGDMTYIENDADVDLIQASGGAIVKNVEGDVTIYEMSTDDIMRMKKLVDEREGATESEE